MHCVSLRGPHRRSTSPTRTHMRACTCMHSPAVHVTGLSPPSPTASHVHVGQMGNCETAAPHALPTMGDRSRER